VRFRVLKDWAVSLPLLVQDVAEAVPLHPTKALGGEEVYLLLILDLGTRWWWGVSVTPWPRFSPGERIPGTYCTGGWVGPRAGLDTEATGKILCLWWGSNLDRPVVQPVARYQMYINLKESWITTWDSVIAWITAVRLKTALADKCLPGALPVAQL
jgi:hypothetical protein